MGPGDDSGGGPGGPGGVGSGGARRVWRFGDDVNTDLITPGRFNLTTDEKRLAGIVFIEARPAFAKEVRPGDLLVAGRNFGCGSSRESAARGLKACGLGAVVAGSFGRIFYRNAVNIGLPVFTSEAAVGLLEDGEAVALDAARGALVRGRDGRAIPLAAPAGVAGDVVAAGGIVPYINARRGWG